MERLRCVAQTYAWGKRGNQSRVAQLMEGGDPDFDLHADTAYAELWMGTHPNGPARIVRSATDGELLSDWLKMNRDAAGSSAWGGELPFLFKVLSVAKALSIQAHPDQELARSLHTKFPDMYKDPNHKPEMAIALTRFEALCQFRPLQEIVMHVESVPELKAIVGEEAAQDFLRCPDERSLRVFFRNFIHADQVTIASQICNIRTRLEGKVPSELSAVEALVVRLITQFDADIGCFCPYLLNYITLQPGEAVFLGANEPHAYLSGDCIECMACSDNVVRAGLTPKFIDKDTLCRMLTYRTETPTILLGDRVDDNVRVYSPPVPEFEVEVFNIDAGKQYHMWNRKGVSVLLVTRGTGTALHTTSRRSFELCPGRVFLIGANESVVVSATDGFQAFRAFPNEKGFTH